MAKLTFVGGIHPYDGKDLSKDKPIQDVLPKGEMVYPLSHEFFLSFNLSMVASVASFIRLLFLRLLFLRNQSNLSAIQTQTLYFM